MKKYLLFFIAVMSMFIVTVNAKIRDIKLITEYNTGYKSYYINDDFIVLVDPFNEKDSETIAINAFGHKLYGIDYPVFLHDDNYMYTYFMAKKSESLTEYTILKYDKKTGKELKRLVVPYDKEMNIQLIFFNENGIVFRDWWDNDCFVVDKDLNGYTEPEVTSELLQNVPYVYKSAYEVKGDEYERVMTFLSEDFSRSEFPFNKVVKYGDLYYTIILKPGNIYSIVVADLNLTEYKMMPISYENAPAKSGKTTYNYQVMDFAVTQDNLVVVSKGTSSCPVVYSIGEHLGDVCDANNIVQIYNVIYDVKTKTSGHGKINVSRSIGENGEEVLFEIVPDEGYALGDVLVTDSTGKMVKFASNKFTMPSADVVIEAKFIKAPINPGTTAFINFNIILAIICLGLFIVGKKNLKKLNRYDV